MSETIFIIIPSNILKVSLTVILSDQREILLTKKNLNQK